MIQTINKETFVFKFTRPDGTTRNGVKFELNKWTKVPKPYSGTPGTGDLCSDRWLHCYRNFYNAVQFHYNSSFYTKLFICKARGKILHTYDKSGVTEIMPIKEIKYNNITALQKTAFNVLLRYTKTKNEFHKELLKKWLSNTNRKEIDPLLTALGVSSYYNICTNTSAECHILMHILSSSSKWDVIKLIPPKTKLVTPKAKQPKRKRK